jgi:hypothetical protein
MRILGGLSAVTAFALLCWDAGIRVSEAYPTVRRCLSDPVRYAGREVWIMPGKVETSDSDSFVVLQRDGKVRVRSTARPAPGEYVFIRGIFEPGGTLEGRLVEVNPRFRAERAGVVGCSLAILAVFAWMFHRTFVWREGAFHVRA